MMARSVVVDRNAQGGLRVSPERLLPGGGVLDYALPVAGGLLELNVSAPDQGLSALISDVVDAAWWVPFVFGDDVLEALTQLDEDEDAEARIVTVVPRDEELSETALRLLYGFWLRRWAPPRVYGTPVEEWLLDSELGALAARGEALFGSDEVAVAMLQGHRAHLADALAEVVRSTATSALADAFAGDTVAGVVQRAAFAAADLLEPDAPGGGELACAVDAVRSAQCSAGRSVPAEASPEGAEPSLVESTLSAALDSLAELRENLRVFPQQEFALAAGAHGGSTSGSGPVDWTEVHPRQFSAQDSAVSWSVDVTGDRPVVVVSVSAPADEVTIPVEPGELYARVEADGALRAAAFEYDSSAESFVARCAVETGSGALVSVYSDLYGSGGRAATPAEEARSVRAAVLTLCSRRVQDVRQGSAYVAPYAFERVALGLAARTKQDERVEQIVGAALDEIDLEWLVLSESTAALRGSSAFGVAEATSLAGRDPRLAIRATAMRLRDSWRVRLISLGFEGPLAVRIRHASGNASDHVVEIPEDGDALIEIPVVAGDLPVGLRLTAIDR